MHRTADDLATIARKLDDMEDATFDEELKAKRRGRSANYDDSGFFSLQVSLISCWLFCCH